jgi:hypothetical protein
VRMACKVYRAFEHAEMRWQPQLELEQLGQRLVELSARMHSDPGYISLLSCYNG